MRFFTLILITSFVLLFTNLILAGNYLPQSPLIKNNIKEYPLLKTARGTIDEKTGIFRYHYDLYETGYTGSAEDIARSYLKDHFKEYGLDVSTNTLKTTRVRQTPGGFHVFFDQVINNIPVYDGKLVVTLNPQKAVTFVASHYRPTIRAQQVKALISGDQAITIARDYLQVTGKLLGEQKANLVWSKVRIGARNYAGAFPYQPKNQWVIGKCWLMP